MGKLDLVTYIKGYGKLEGGRIFLKKSSRFKKKKLNKYRYPPNRTNQEKKIGYLGKLTRGTARLCRLPNRLKRLPSCRVSCSPTPLIIPHQFHSSSSRGKTPEVENANTKTLETPRETKFYGKRGNFSLPEEENAKRKCSETQGKIAPWKKRKEIQAKARKDIPRYEKKRERPRIQPSHP